MKNALAYCGTVLITTVKDFTAQALGVNVTSFFSSQQNKLECSSLTSIFRLVCYFLVKPGVLGVLGPYSQISDSPVTRSSTLLCHGDE